MVNGRKLTVQEKGRFIKRLVLTGGNVSKAAKAAGISRTAAYSHRNDDESFAAAWDEAIENGVDDLLQKLRTYALKMDGNASVRAAEFLIKAKRPEYRERTTQDMNIRVEELTDEELAQLIPTRT
jgi:hypothetical protein